MKNYTRDDSGFLNLLNGLRHQVTSHKVFYPLSRDSVSRFLDWDDAISRLSQLQGGEHNSKVKELEEAIALGRDH